MLKKLQIKKDNQIFSRFEIKYIINKQKSEIIQKEIKNFMTYDGHIDKKIKKKKYYVRSIYFDNYKYDNFNEKVDGLKVRHKYRIRTYSKNLLNKINLFLEQKGRNNERTYKVRSRIKIDDLSIFLKKKKIFSLKKKYKNFHLIEKFIFDCYRKNLSPNVIIDYDRRPFINNTGIYFRLTFDSNLRACISDTLFRKNYNWKKCIDGYEILEVKFDRTIPVWFHKIIQSFELKRVSVSKYVLGLESTGLAEDYEGK